MEQAAQQLVTPLRFVRGIVAALAMVSAPAWANYAQCLIENLASSQSGAVHAAAVTLCTAKFPDGFYTIERGSGRGILGFKSPEACTIASAKNTSWQPSAGLIRNACNCLYSAPTGAVSMCARYQLRQDILVQHPGFTTDAQLLALEHHYRRIYTAHPDADEIFNRKDFQAWWVNDPARAKVLTSGDTGQIIKLMSDFKAHLASNSGPWGVEDRQTTPPTR